MAIGRRVLLSLSGIALALGVCEAGSRWVYRAPWQMRLLGEQGRDERIQYHLNQLGLRDRDYAAAKAPSTRPVLIVGDSFTFGLGVANDADVFPELIERMLNESSLPGPAATEVLNGGLPGSLTSDWVTLVHRVQSFQPDVILAVFFLRDGTRTGAMPAFFDPIRDEIATRNHDSPIYRHSYLYRILRDRFDRRRIADLYTAALKRSYSGTPEETAEWRSAQENILSLRQFAQEHGAVLGLAIFPILVDIDEDYPFRAICDAIADFAVRNQIPVHNLLGDFAGHDASGLWVSPLNQHPNERGHAVAADALLPFVRRLLDAGAPERGRSIGSR